jgi:hypothetical protein
MRWDQKQRYINWVKQTILPVAFRITLCMYAGLFYYMLGNIDPKYRSRTESIQLLTIVRTTLINKYGINKILEPLIEKLNLLERVRMHTILFYSRSHCIIECSSWLVGNQWICEERLSCVQLIILLLAHWEVLSIYTQHSESAAPAWLWMMKYRPR